MEVTGWWIGSGGYVIWPLRVMLCLKTRSVGIVLLYKDKGERSACKKYRGISLLSVVRKIYVWILLDKVNRMTGSLIHDQQGGFRGSRGCVDQIFT